MKGRTFVGVAELALEVAGILSESGPVQERGTVRDVPDERTIRYYLSEGLLSPAEDKQGTASVFGYLHLLQLLVVKRLQAQHLPIRKIKELVEGRTERELERLLGSDEKQKNEAINYLESLLTSRASAPLTKASAPVPGSYSQPASPALSPPAQRVTAGSSWSRVEIEPGLELHVRDDYEPPRESKGMQRLASAIIQGINRRLGKRRR
ncbi:MAG TPA: MerR family transcriptional regulator [Pyrinomonadaceae bacterium]